MKKIKLLKIAVAMLVAGFTLTSCDDDEDHFHPRHSDGGDVVNQDPWLGEWTWQSGGNSSVLHLRYDGEVLLEEFEGKKQTLAQSGSYTYDMEDGLLIMEWGDVADYRFTSLFPNNRNPQVMRIYDTFILDRSDEATATADSLNGKWTSSNGDYEFLDKRVVVTNGKKTDTLDYKYEPERKALEMGTAKENTIYRIERMENGKRLMLTVSESSDKSYIPYADYDKTY